MPIKRPNPEADRTYVRKTLVINKYKDPDVLRKLLTEKSANEYILNLIRNDIRKDKKEE